MVLAHKQKYQPMEQDRESREKTHAPMGTLCLTKEARIYNGSKITSSISGAGKLDSYEQKKEIEYFLMSYTKISSKWIKNLKVRPETIKLLRGKHRKNT